jgi:hypothetical protein
MKKILCFTLIAMICLALVGCSSGTSLKLVDEVKDKYGNILNQTYYNEETAEYLLKTYSYVLQQGTWVCVEQQITIYATTPEPGPECPPYPDANYCGPDLGIVYTY